MGGSSRTNASGVSAITDFQNIDLHFQRIARVEPELEVVLLLGWIERREEGANVKMPPMTRESAFSPRCHNGIWKYAWIGNPNT